MKHFYTLAFTLAALLFPFVAVAQESTEPKMISNTFVLDDEKAVEFVTQIYQDGQYIQTPIDVTLVKGDNVITLEEGKQLVVKGAPEYIIRKYTTPFGDGYLSNNSFTVYYSAYNSDKTYTVTTCHESLYYTATMNVWVENYSKDKMRCNFQSNYREPALQTGDNVVKFNPDDENQLNITGEIYKITVNGVDEPTQNSYQLNVKDGDDIKIYTEYPDMKVPVKFVFSEEGSESVISKLTVAETEVPATEYLGNDFQVQLGSKIVIELNNTDYDVEQFLVNGAEEYVYMAYEGQIKGETTFTINAHKYAEFTKKVIAEGTEHFTFYKGYSNYGGEIIPLKEGENTITLNEKNSTISLVTEAGYHLTLVQDGEMDITGEFSEYNNSITLESTGDLIIKCEKIVMDKSFIIYFDKIEAANQYFGFSSFNRQDYSKSVKDGYNTIEYTKGFDPFSISWYKNPADEHNHLYINGEKQTGLYDQDTNYSLPVQDGDIVKVFMASTPSFFDVTFDNQATCKVAVSHDIILSHEDLTKPLNVLPGTLIKLTAEEGKKVSVKVGDADAVEVESHEFTVDAATKVSIEDVRTSGVENVTVADDADADVYNLQGIRVADKAGFNSLPAGIYIVNGTKVIKK